MGPQIGDHGLEAVLQGVDLRSPGVVVQCGAVQQDDGRRTGPAADPVPDRRVGPHEVVLVMLSHVFLP